MPLPLVDAAVEWAGGPGRKPKLTPQELMGLTEDAREKIRCLILLRKSIPDGPNKRREQLKIGNAIAFLRHPGRVSKSIAAARAKSRWLKRNPERRRISAISWYYRNRKLSFPKSLSQSVTAIRNRRYRKENIQFAIASRLRATMGRALRRQWAKKSARTFELIGCSPEELKLHIERQFVAGMSWDNRHLWHVDHRKALATFDLTKIDQQRAAFHFSNLQPLWATDNIRKGKKEKSPAHA